MHVVQVIDSLVPGGAERSLLATAPLLIRGGVQLDVVSLSDAPGLAADLRGVGCRVDLLGAGGRVATARRLRQLLRERRPDLVHTTLFESDVLGRPAARLAGVPVVTSLVNDAYGPAQRAVLPAWKLRAAQMLDAATARLAVRFHAVSRSVAETMADRLRLSPEIVDVIPRARDDAVLGRRSPSRRAGVRAALGIGDERLLLAVGRHEHQKGFDVLVEAMARLRSCSPPARLLVAGRDGAASAALRGLIDDLGVGELVALIGARNDVADLLAAADVFVLPSRWEGMPGSLIEAMALEVPLVVSDIPPNREVLGPDLPAQLVGVDDVRALAEAIASALQDPRPEQVALARARFETTFRIERAAEQMVTFYRRAVAG